MHDYLEKFVNLDQAETTNSKKKSHGKIFSCLEIFFLFI